MPELSENLVSCLFGPVEQIRLTGLPSTRSTPPIRSKRPSDCGVRREPESPETEARMANDRLLMPRRTLLDQLAAGNGPEGAAKDRATLRIAGRAAVHCGRLDPRQFIINPAT